MERDNTTQHRPDFDQIKPADLTLSSTHPQSTGDKGSRKAESTFWLGALIGGLAALAVLVILLLPNHVQKAEAPLLAAEPSSTGTKQASGKPEASPWQEAQLGIQRKAAQDVLEKLLDHQRQLEELAVEQWAGESFADALSLAAEGDEYYRKREFEAAVVTYEAGLKLMLDLLQSRDQAVADALAAGSMAIAAGDANAASDAFERALSIDADNVEALGGIKRAGVIDEVRGLLGQAREFEENGSIQEALTVAQQAATLDPAHGEIKQTIVHLRSRMNQNEFQGQMSAGYQAFGRENYPAAIIAFKAAVRLDAQSVEARDALGQAQSASKLKAVNDHLQRADEYRKQEGWAMALAEYDQAMEIDNTLVTLRQSRAETSVRARLDAGLQDAITRPERLTSESVWQLAQQLYHQASVIENPGPKLRQQLSGLNKLLQDAIAPIMVTFSSDNLSRVSLYKVAALGSFDTREIELKPGNYVIVASREGYRDVRREFTVAPRSQPVQFVIQCDEQI